MNLKDILNSVLLESGFVEKDQFAQTTDPDDKQMVAIANRVSQEIMKWAQWSVLKKDHTVVMTDSLTYPLPTDFLHLVADSVWEVDGSRQVELPTPNGRWYMYKFSAFSDGGTLRARLYGDTIELYDTQSGEDFIFEYVSNMCITDVNGVPKPYFTMDNDIFILDEETIVRGVQAKWAKTKMMPQADEWRGEYFTTMSGAVARDVGARTIGGLGGDGRMNESPYYPLWQR